MVSGIPLKNLFSLTEPFGPPSPEAPLSETSTMMRVVQLARLSPGSRAAARSDGRRGSGSRRRPRPCGENSCFSSSVSESQAARCPARASPCRPGSCRSVYGLIGDSSACSGMMPIFFWSVEDELAVGLVAHVELALVLVDPLLRGVVRSVAGARAVVQEERLVRGDRLGVADERHRLVGDVLGEVVALLRALRLFDRVVVVHQVRVPLVGLGAQEAVEALEAAPERPLASCVEAMFISSSGSECHLPTCTCSSRARPAPRRWWRTRTGCARSSWGTRTPPR